MSYRYFQNYIPVLLLLGVLILLAGGMLLLSYLLGTHRPTRAKLAPYECGIAPTGDARQRFSVKFYLVAMVFILFDVEVVFLYPWAVIFHQLRMFGFLEMLLFLLLVLPGFIYLWKKGVLDWSATEKEPDAGELR
ncbi:MAG: NADH-quinone oxidoreductase subunit A [Acidobacteria bacterium]|nr:NADH-quinone oxidoreductase subunit A [Acidobacteriota bacterium]